jgi:hypothetical protein
MVKKRTAIVDGYRLDSANDARFEGKIEFDLHDDCVYYIWELESAGGDFLGGKGQQVSFHIIPENEDMFEFALKHAIENINRARQMRKRVFRVETFFWKD